MGEIVKYQPPRNRREVEKRAAMELARTEHAERLATVVAASRLDNGSSDNQPRQPIEPADQSGFRWQPWA